MARDEVGASGVASAVATAFAVLAVLAVLASATAAGVSYRSDDEPAADPPPAAPSSSSGQDDGEDEEDTSQERFFPDGQVLTGDRAENANIEIPSTDEGWTYAAGSSVLEYAREMSDGSLGVDGPYLFRDGECTAGGRSYHEASIGFDRIGPGEGDDVRQVLEDRVATWQSLLFEDYDEPPADVDYSEISLSDGTPAEIATFRYATRLSPDKCISRDATTERRIMAFDSGDDIAVVLLARGVEPDGSDLPDGLSAADADAILAAARIQQDDQ